jgi:hypothetical protein
MRRLIRVLSVLLPMLCAAQVLSAQDPGRDTQRGQVNGFELEQNYPNPFNPHTTIPFILGEGLFVGGGSAVVSLRIFNILSQLVAHPVALRHPAGEGLELIQLEYAQPGRYEAYWDGTDQEGRQVASGMYFMQLTVNGQTIVKRMYVLK